MDLRCGGSVLVALLDRYEGAAITLWDLERTEDDGAATLISRHQMPQEQAFLSVSRDKGAWVFRMLTGRASTQGGGLNLVVLRLYWPMRIM